MIASRLRCPRVTRPSVALAHRHELIMTLVADNMQLVSDERGRHTAAAGAGPVCVARSVSEDSLR